jgi:hypothetical protein
MTQEYHRGKGKKKKKTHNNLKHGIVLTYRSSGMRKIRDDVIYLSVSLTMLNRPVWLLLHRLLPYLAMSRSHSNNDPQWSTPFNGHVK